MTTIALIILFAALFEGGALAYSTYRHDTYTSESLLVVQAADPAVTSGTAIAAVWAKVATSDTIIVPLASELGVNPSELRKNVTVVASTTAPLVTVDVTSSSADMSALWANRLSDALITRATADPIVGFALRRATSALPPQRPDGNLALTWLLVAPAVGALIGFAVGRTLLYLRAA